MYKSVDKFKPKPSLKGLDDFLIHEGSDSSRFHRLSSRQTTHYAGGQRNKITFYDMKSPDEVMRKI